MPQLDYAPVPTYRRRRTGTRLTLVVCGVNVVGALALAYVFRNFADAFFWWVGTVALIPWTIGFTIVAVRHVQWARRNPDEDVDEVRVESGRLVLTRGGTSRTIDLADLASVERWRSVRVRRSKGGKHTHENFTEGLRLRDGRTVSLAGLPTGGLRRLHEAVRREAPHVTARTRRTVRDTRTTPATVTKQTWRGHGCFGVKFLRRRLGRLWRRFTPAG